MSLWDAVEQELEAAGIRVGQKWRHYKGGLYVIAGFSLHEPTQAVNVLYYLDHSAAAPTRAHGLIPWSRTLRRFVGDVDSTGRKRFVLEVQVGL